MFSPLSLVFRGQDELGFLPQRTDAATGEAPASSVCAGNKSRCGGETARFLRGALQTNIQWFQSVLRVETSWRGSEGRVKIKAQRFQTALPPTASHSFRKFLEESVSCDHHQHGSAAREAAVRPEEAGAAEPHLPSVPPSLEAVASPQTAKLLQMNGHTSGSEPDQNQIRSASGSSAKVLLDVSPPPLAFGILKPRRF